MHNQSDQKLSEVKIFSFKATLEVINPLETAELMRYFTVHICMGCVCLLNYFSTMKNKRLKEFLLDFEGVFEVLFCDFKRSYMIYWCLT